MIHPMDTLKEDEKYVFIKPCKKYDLYRNCIVKVIINNDLYYHNMWVNEYQKCLQFFHKSDFIIINTKEEYEKFSKIVQRIYHTINAIPFGNNVIWCNLL
jgi:hypothetical protein